MRIFLLPSVVCLACLANIAFGDSVGTKLQAVSVNIKAPGKYGQGSQGSGTVILRQVDGKQNAFVLTAAHVIRGLRDVSDAIVDGKEKKIVTYRDAQIVQEVGNNDNSRIVGDTRLDAKVIATDYRRDIALLRVRAVGTLKSSARFYDGPLPEVGTEVYHCGAPGGQDTGGTATLTAGIISRTGVRIAEYGGAEHGIFDQTDTAALPGSSGGLLATRQDGHWIGMITLGLRGGDNFHWFVPIRNVREWSQEAKCEWLLKHDGNATEKAVGEIPLELSPPEVSGGNAAPSGTMRNVIRHTTIFNPFSRQITASD